MFEPFKKIKNLLQYLFVTLPFEFREKAFIRHNRRIWGPECVKTPSGEVLVEVHPVASTVIAQSYMANFLAKKWDSSIIGYNTGHSNFLKKVYSFRIHRIYRSFNVDHFFYMDPSSYQQALANAKAREILNNLKTKKDVEGLKIYDLWIGDLLYDSYLMKYRVPTIDFADPNFFASLEEALAYYFYWTDYLDTHKVRALVVSHCCYFENGLVVRLCIQRGIPVYQANAAYCHLLDQRHDRAYIEYLHYPEEFEKLSSKEQEEGIALAKQRLELRFQGKPGVDMHYSTKSAYSAIKDERLLKNTDKLKILVATHCFFDSPHPFGNGIFPDFYEWLHFLGEVSKQTDYEWYIKTHPDVLPGNVPILQEIVSQYPNFHFLPADSSHNQLIAEGVKVALTVYGTIGSEYAARGLLVLNAGLGNPHVAYPFNLHFDDIDSYKNALLQLNKLSISIETARVYEYYFMHNLNQAHDWLFTDYKKFVADLGSFNASITSKAYEYFLKGFSNERHGLILKTLSNFVDSKEYLLKKQHIQSAQHLANLSI